MKLVDGVPSVANRSKAQSGMHDHELKEIKELISAAKQGELKGAVMQRRASLSSGSQGSATAKETERSHQPKNCREEAA